MSESATFFEDLQAVLPKRSVIAAAVAPVVVSAPQFTTSEGLFPGSHTYCGMNMPQGTETQL